MSYKKIVLTFSLLAIFGLLFSLNLSEVKALTAAEIRAQITKLQEQIASLQKQLLQVQKEEVWCHDFKVNLRYGDKGEEVKALQTAFSKQGFYKRAITGNFDQYTASAVMGFQEKYKKDILTPWGLKYGTGFVGGTTRAKLNALYGCEVTPLAPAKAYFEFTDVHDDRFIFKLTDPGKIKEARDILAGKVKDKIHVMGKIVKTPAPYNPLWSCHLDPPTIEFFSFMIEVCDGAIYMACDFPEGETWCPWSSELTQEIGVCFDETPYGYCSLNKPKYCDNGALTENCQKCGCPEEEICQEDGTCEEEQKYPYPPSEILYFNPEKDSGWFYIAQTIPYKGLAFWAAAIRSLSTVPVDTSAQLLYGITNEETGEYYAGVSSEGSFSESADKVDLFYQKDEEKLLEFQQTKEDLSEFRLTVNLPWEQGFFQATNTIALKRPLIYESGDGVIPMGEGVDSLYVSLPLEQGFWADFQKFNFSTRRISRFGEANHRWGSFILDKATGSLSARTVGVYWEILDENNQRQPGGYTNFDLLIPDTPQETREDFEIEEIEYWDSGNKTYLKKWKVLQKDLGVDLLFETLIDNQENSVAGSYFYEGMVKVFDPKSKAQIGTGMLEQTHDEEIKSITVTSPNGGEKWRIGSSQKIAWELEEVTKVNIYLYDYGAEEPKPYTIAKGISGSSYQWSISNIYPVSSKLKVKVQDYDDSDVYDYSDNYFSTLPEIKCADTDGGIDYYTKGTCKDGKASHTDYCLSVEPGNQLVEWSCKENLCSSTIYTCPYDCSNGACLKRYLTITSPNGGEKWTIGTAQAITWTSDGVSKVNIYLYDYGAAEKKHYSIAIGVNSGPTGGTYQWSIPNSYPISDKLKMKIRDYSYPSVYDYSDGHFSLVKLVKPECADSDEGTDYYTKGTCQDGIGTYTDYCSAKEVNSNPLTEYYCISATEIATGQGSTCGSVTYTCPDGCSDGACLGEKIGLKNIENQLANISQAVSRLSERIKETLERR